MGAIVEDLPTTAAPWQAELRRHSFYISTSEIEGPPLLAALDEPWSIERPSFGRVRIPVDLVHAFRAALEHVAAQPRVAAVERALSDRWRVLAEGDTVEVAGPAWLYGLRTAGAGWAEVHTLEIDYRDLPLLLDALAGMSPRAHDE